MDSILLVSDENNTANAVNATPTTKIKLRNTNKCKQWAGFFVERVYLVCNQIYPRMGLDNAAVEYISQILARILLEMLESNPESPDDLLQKVKESFPSALTNFVTKQNLQRLANNKRWLQGKSKESKSLSSLYLSIQGIANELIGRKVDEIIVAHLMSVLEYILYDILNWTGMYISKLMDESNTISIAKLKTAINADRGLSELTEILFNDDEESSTYGVFNLVPPSPLSTSSQKTPLNYEKICTNFRDAEIQFMRELSLIINVFKRRLENCFTDDMKLKDLLKQIFGNVVDIYELTIKIHRTIEDGLDLSDPPVLGQGFWELAEGCEFDAYIQFVEVFLEPLSDKIGLVLEHPNLLKYDDRFYSGTPDSFRNAIKYVLPSLLHSILRHFRSYIEFVKLMHAASESEADRRDLYNTEMALNMVAKKIQNLKLQLCHQFEKPTQNENSRAYHLNHIHRIQRSIDGWSGKEIGYMCNEFIREGDLFKIRSTPTIAENLLGSKSYSERHVFLFDRLLVICKALKLSVVKGGCNQQQPQISYKFKGKLYIQKADIVDLEDDNDLKNAFRIYVSKGAKSDYVSNITFFCGASEDKIGWMNSLIQMQTAGLLHRMLEMYKKEEERRIPL